MRSLTIAAAMLTIWAAPADAQLRVEKRLPIAFPTDERIHAATDIVVDGERIFVLDHPSIQMLARGDGSTLARWELGDEVSRIAPAPGGGLLVARGLEVVSLGPDGRERGRFEAARGAGRITGLSLDGNEIVVAYEVKDVGTSIGWFTAAGRPIGRTHRALGPGEVAPFGGAGEAIMTSQERGLALFDRAAGFRQPLFSAVQNREFAPYGITSVTRDRTRRRVYAVDYSHNRLAVFDRRGGLVEACPRRARGPRSPLDGPTAAAVGSDGRIYLATSRSIVVLSYRKGAVCDPDPAAIYSAVLTRRRYGSRTAPSTLAAGRTLRLNVSKQAAVRFCVARTRAGSGCVRSWRRTIRAGRSTLRPTARNTAARRLRSGRYWLRMGTSSGISHRVAFTVR